MDTSPLPPGWLDHARHLRLVDATGRAHLQLTVLPKSGGDQRGVAWDAEGRELGRVLRSGSVLRRRHIMVRGDQPVGTIVRTIRPSQGFRPRRQWRVDGTQVRADRLHHLDQFVLLIPPSVQGASRDLALLLPLVVATIVDPDPGFSSGAEG